MEKAEFDQYATEYNQMLRDSIRITGESPDYFAEYKIKDIRRYFEMERKGLEPRTILDFGGGIGASAPFLSRFFPKSNILIADVSASSLAIAAEREIPRCETLVFDGKSLPLDANSQDIVLAACVFHHIPADQHEALFAEIKRVLAPGGSLFVFEHNPWNPLTVRAVNTCPFDENAVLINSPTLRRRIITAGFSPDNVEVAFRIFFPNMLRGLRPAEAYLKRLPLGAQYFVRAEKEPSA